MACCAVGPCDKSRQRGGPGCYLCDEVTQVPQAPTLHTQMARRLTRVTDAAREKLLQVIEASEDKEDWWR